MYLSLIWKNKDYPTTRYQVQRDRYPLFWALWININSLIFDLTKLRSSPIFYAVNPATAIWPFLTQLQQLIGKFKFNANQV